MKKIWLGFIFLIFISLVAAGVYHEPWNGNQDGNEFNLTNMDVVEANTFIGSFSGNITGYVNASYITNPFWVDEAGDTMTGNLIMDEVNVSMKNSSEVHWTENGGRIYVNATCIIIDSPAGTGTLTICD